MRERDRPGIEVLTLTGLVFTALAAGPADALTEDATPGLPTLEIEQLVGEGDTVGAVGNGSVALATGGRLVLVFCDVLTLAGDRISHLASQQVELNGPVRWHTRTPRRGSPALAAGP